MIEAANFDSGYTLLFFLLGFLLGCMFCWLPGGSALLMVVCTLFVYSSFTHSLFSQEIFITSGSMGLVFLCIMIGWMSLNGERVYPAVVGVLVATLVFCFVVDSAVLFYFLFEASLIPTLILIIMFGYRPERMSAGTAMMLYTVAASLPLLAGLLWVGFVKGTYSKSLLKLSMMHPGMFLSVALLAAFLVKLPVYSVHLWLPKAHVEAPMVGSMLLAGVLLKLGGFGIFLVASFCSFPKVDVLFMGLSLWGGLLAAFMCLKQTDLKAFIAYSSVFHMTGVLCGVFSSTVWGLYASYFIMLSHGLSSAALFCLSAGVAGLFNSRSFQSIGGLLSREILVGWFMLCCLSMGLPPFLGFFGEVLTFSALIVYPVMIFVWGLLLFFGGVCAIYLYSSVGHGFSNTTRGSSSRVLLVSSSAFLPSLGLVLCLGYLG